MERMNHSEGPAKVQRSCGRTRFGSGETNDLIYFFRQKFPEFFKKTFTNNKFIPYEEGKYTFDQLLEARKY